MSRENPKAGVPNRFFGLFTNGKTKVRGIELRRSDTPPFLRRAQEEMLGVLYRAKNPREYLALAPRVLKALEGYLAALREGRVDVRELALTRRLSQEPMQYEKASTTAIAAQELVALGVKLHAGERVKLVLTDTSAPFPGDRAKALALWDGSRGYDVGWYEEELLKTAASLLFPAGMDSEALQARFPARAPSLPVRPPRRPAGGRRRRADQLLGSDPTRQVFGTSLSREEYPQWL